MKNTNKETFVKRLESAKSRLDLSQKELAAKAKISESTISKCLNSAIEYMPTVDNLLSLAKALDVSTDWLLGLSDRERTEDRLTARDIGKMLMECLSIPGLNMKLCKVSREEWCQWCDEDPEHPETEKITNTYKALLLPGKAILFSEWQQDDWDEPPFDNYCNVAGAINNFLSALVGIRKLYCDGVIDKDTFSDLVTTTLNRLSNDPLPPAQW